MAIGKKLEVALKKKGMKPATLASEIGVSKNTIYAIIKRDNEKVNMSTLNKIADVLGITIDYFFGDNEDMETYASPRSRPDFFPASAVRPLSEMHHQRVPMIGSVAAGEPILDADFDTYLEAPCDCDAAVTVRGDSMEPTYYDGDILYIRQQPTVRKGQIAVVFVDDMAAIKHVYREHDGVMLVSDNPAYPPMRYRFGDNADAINIFGIPIGFTRMFTR